MWRRDDVPCSSLFNSCFVCGACLAQLVSTKRSPAYFSFGLGRAELDKKEKGGGLGTPGPDFLQPEGLGKQVGLGLGHDLV